tara:strand:- start:107 stop:532 length:426 start_codon:yes stop_codon:yes gene_type:complete
MRASAVRTAIVDAIEAISPGSQVSTEDVYRAHDFDTPARDRAFRVDRIGPQAPAQSLITTLGATADPYEITFEITVLYVEGPGTTARKLDDGDQCIDALRELTEQAQIRTVEIRPGADVLDPGGFWLVNWDLTVQYDRRDA